MVKTNKNILCGIVTGIFICVLIFKLWPEFLSFNSFSKGDNPKTNISAYSFGVNGDDLKDDSTALQSAIDFAEKSNIGLVTLQGNKNFILKSGIKIKSGVTLELGYNTKLFVEGNFRAIEVHNNASIINGIIEVSTADFDSEVIYMSGSEKFWTSSTTEITNVKIINTSESNKGTGIYLHSEKAGDFISFINFKEIKIVGFDVGIRLLAEEKGFGTEGIFSYINGNRFINLTIDDCKSYIELDSSVSIPNEVSGNEFVGLQIQISEATKSIMYVSGSNNRFEMMVWDIQMLKTKQPIIKFTSESANSQFISNLDKAFVLDEGYLNKYAEY